MTLRDYFDLLLFGIVYLIMGGLTFGFVSETATFLNAPSRDEKLFIGTATVLCWPLPAVWGLLRGLWWLVRHGPIRAARGLGAIARGGRGYFARRRPVTVPTATVIRTKV